MAQARPPVSRADEDNEALVFAIHSGHTATAGESAGPRVRATRGAVSGAAHRSMWPGTSPTGRDRVARATPLDAAHGPATRQKNVTSWLRDRCARWDEDA